MKFTEHALREYRLTLALVLCAVITGVYAFWEMPRREDPEIHFRYGLVTAIYPGASAERVEAEVLIPVEEALSDMAEIEFVETEARLNGGFSLIKFKDEITEVEAVFDEVRRRMAAVRETMPKGVEGPALKEDFSEIYGIIATVASDTASPAELANEAARLRRELLRQPEVARVEVFGEQRERVVIEYDDLDLAEFNISPIKLTEFLKYQNYLLPGGPITLDNQQMQVEPRTTLSSVAELEALAVAVPGEDEPYQLADLLLVERRLKIPADATARGNDRNAVGIGISMRKGGDLELWGKQVEQVLAEAQAAGAFQYQIVMHEPDRVNGRINKFFENLLYSLLVVSVMLLLTLGLRTGLVVTAIMPMVVLTVFAIMLLTGMELNLVSLTAFVIILGILVDNHIVIAERIITSRQAGQEKTQAALYAAESLQWPLLTAALVTIAGFLPVYLAQTSAGEYASPLFYIVAITLLVSLAYGITLTPYLSTKLFKVSPKEAGQANNGPLLEKTHALYCRLLRRLLEQRFLVLGAALLAFVGAILSAGQIHRIFFPESDRPILTLDLVFPGGQSIAKTDEAMQAVDQYIAENFAEDGVDNWVTLAGRNAPRFVLNFRPRQYQPEYGSMLIKLKNNDHFAPLAQGLEEFCESNFPEAICRVRRIESGPAVGWPVQVRVSGNDNAALRETAGEVKAFLGTMDGLANLNDNWGEPVGQFQIIPKPEEAAKAGVLHAEIAAAAQGYLTGLPAGEIRNQEETLPLWVQARTLKTPVEDLQNLYVFAHQTESEPVPLQEVADVLESEVPPKVLRRNQQRAITLQADVLDQSKLTSLDDAIAAWLADKAGSWPQGIDVEMAGAGYEARRANRSILKQLPWAILLMVALLLAQTRSFRATLIILSAVPMGLIGVVAGLILTNQPFGFMTLVGIIALTGIVINNAIILIERIRTNRENPELCDTTACVLEAAVNRLRPIVLTTVTTVGGILPLFMRGNPVFQPLAAALISGLLCSMVMVLFVLPALYAAWFGLKDAE